MNHNHTYASSGSMCEEELVPTDLLAGVSPPADIVPLPRELPKYRGTPAWKRLLDMIGSAVLIVMLSPLLVAIAIYVKCVSRGPVFFTQMRMGAGGEDFKIYKFRTMATDETADAEHRLYIESLTDSELAAEKPDHVDRLIKGGHFLRGHSLDELPQLFNVLLGNMSLVGPRPEVLRLEDYPQWQLRRFEVIPGMTGLWQVSGKNALSFTRMVELDIEYIERQSVWLDVKILFKTFAVVLKHDNA